MPREPIPADLNGSDLFGLGLAIRNDTALIGAFNKELSGAAAAGSAYVFRNQQGTWVEGERLVASNPGAGAQLGFDVALSDFQAFAGAYQGNDGSRSAGVVYEYSFNGLPNAVDDEFNSAEDFPVAGNVLNANPAIPDSDPDGDPIRVANPGVFVAGGIGGDVELTESGALAYQPPADVTGEALFDYQLTDGRGGFSTGTVRINVAPAADLQIDKISNSFFTEPGGTISYTIEIANPGPSDVIGATVDDQLPPRLGNATWECIADPGASCAADGTGDLADEPVDLPEGTSVIFTLDAELLDTENDPITNTASVTAPVGVLELVPANNVDSDTDLVGLFADGMESVEP